jgi:pyruvate dehydrogenase (quinone)/pyruvate oxidase
VLEALVDPNEPPMPGKVKPEQAMKFAKALVKGQPQGPRIALTAFRDKIDEYV